MAAEVRQLTPHEIEEQYRGAVRLAPGIWLDARGDVHWSVPELLALVDLEDTPENREAVAAIAENVARQHGVSTIRQEPKC